MTSAVVASLVQLARDLERVDARWALVGGFAVSARAEPRFTRDVDVCVLALDDEEAERIALSMVRLGYSVASVIEHQRAMRLATLRLISPVADGVFVDLLFASTGLEPDAVESAEALEILPGLVVPVARAAHLVVMKLLARDDVSRPQDGLDLRALRHTLTPDDAADVRRLAQEVTTRGYHRGRNLVALAETYLAGR